MAIICSDSFDGKTSSLTGQSLDNALGGSGSRIWASASGAGLTAGSNVVYSASSNSGKAVVDLTGISGGFQATMDFSFNGSAAQNIRVSALLDVLEETGTYGCVHALLVGGNSLRIREQTPSNADRATKSISALNTSLWYKLRLIINGLSWTAAVLNSDGSPYDSVSYTASSAPSGTLAGFGLYSASAMTPRFDNWIVETLDAPPPSIVRPRGGFIL